MTGSNYSNAIHCTPNKDAGIKCQVQVINDDKGWIQLQQLSLSQVGDHTAIIPLDGGLPGKVQANTAD